LKYEYVYRSSVNRRRRLDTWRCCTQEKRVAHAHWGSLPVVFFQQTFKLLVVHILLIINLNITVLASQKYIYIINFHAYVLMLRSRRLIKHPPLPPTSFPILFSTGPYFPLRFPSHFSSSSISLSGFSVSPKGRG
jgi:hypothetical protein